MSQRGFEAQRVLKKKEMLVYSLFLNFDIVFQIIISSNFKVQIFLVKHKSLELLEIFSLIK